MIQEFFEAVRLLTILPVPKGEPPKDNSRAFFFFPLVGILLALVSLALVRILSLSLFSRLEALGLVTVPILLTGGRSLRNFAKTFQETFGVFLLLFWKWALLEVLPGRGAAFLLAVVAGRWAQVVLVYFFPVAETTKAGTRELAGATAFFAAVVVFLGGSGVLCFLTLLPFLWGAGFYLSKRFGKTPPEALGALSEATELFVLLCLFLATRGGIR